MVVIVMVIIIVIVVIQLPSVGSWVPVCGRVLYGCTREFVIGPRRAMILISYFAFLTLHGNKHDNVLKYNMKE